MGFGIKLPKVPKLGQVFGGVTNSPEVQARLDGTPEYLVSMKKGKGPEKVYRGDIDDKGKVTFKEVTDPAQLQRFKDRGIPVDTVETLQHRISAANAPGALDQSLRREAAADEILSRLGKRALDTSTDHIAGDLAKRGKGVDVAGNIGAARTELIAELEQRQTELAAAVKAGKLKDDKPIPGDPNGTTPHMLRDAIKGEIATLREQQEPGAVLDAFRTQVLNPSPAGNPLDNRAAATTAPVNPLDR